MGAGWGLSSVALSSPHVVVLGAIVGVIADVGALWSAASSLDVAGILEVGGVLMYVVWGVYSSYAPLYASCFWWAIRWARWCCLLAQ